MILNGDQIRDKLKNVWHDLGQIWLTDPKYLTVTAAWLERIIEHCSVKDLKFDADVWDCDNFALQFHARVQLFQYELIQSSVLDAKCGWAIGECIGFSDGVFTSGVHAQNIIITENGIVLFEPQTDTIIKTFNDNLFFVKF